MLGRSKPLGTEAAKHAAKMRIIKVCLPCSVMKIRVSIRHEFRANITKYLHSVLPAKYVNHAKIHVCPVVLA